MVSYSVWIITFVLLTVLMVVSATAEPLPDKSPAPDKRTFFVGSRYGRSPAGTKARRVNVAPRNDRFFLGSRYGKRSYEYLPADVEQDDTSNQSNQFVMTCVYTGLKDYFRCNSVKDINNLIQYLYKEDTETN